MAELVHWQLEQLEPELVTDRSRGERREESTKGSRNRCAQNAGTTSTPQLVFHSPNRLASRASIETNCPKVPTMCVLSRQLVFQVPAITSQADFLSLSTMLGCG